MSCVEESWTLIGTYDGTTWRARRLRYRSGEVASVVADGAWALRREEIHGDVVGFMHTHPMGGLAPSSRDIRTMRAWCDAFGKRLLCVIATPHAVGAWVFDGYQSAGARIASVEIAGKTKVIGVESHGRETASRRALPRRRAAGASRGPARGARRRRGGRIQPRG